MAFIENLEGLDLETILQCPVCFELPPPPIFLCVRGHHVCGNCRTLLNVCPTCKASLTKTRNFLAEDLLQKLDFIPKWKKRPQDEERNCSCTKKKLRKNQTVLPKHNLPKGVFKCPLEGCKDGTNELGICTLIPHIKKAHGHLYSNFTNNVATFTTDFILQYKKQKHYQKAFNISNMGLFFLSVRIFGDSNINCCLRCTAAETVGNRFQYELIVSNTKQSFSFIDEIPPLEKGTSWLLKRGRALVIPAKDHSLLGEFNVKITIVYKVKTKNKKQKCSGFNY